MNSIDAEQSTSNGSPGSWTAAHRTNQTVMMMIIIIKFGKSNFSCSSTSAEQESFLSSVCHLWTQLVKLRAFLPSCLYGVCLPQLSYLSHANLCCWLCTPNIAELRSAVESQVQLESFVCLSVMLTSCGWGFLEWDFPCLLIHMSQAQEDSWRFSSQHVYPNFAGKWACEFNPEKERCIMLHLCSITRVSSAMMLAAKCKDSLTSNLL